MSKVKEAYVKQLENDFELDLSYQEWLRDNFSQPSELEVDEMNEEINPSLASNRIISDKPINNQDYDPTYSA